MSILNNVSAEQSKRVLRMRVFIIDGDGLRDNVEDIGILMPNHPSLMMTTYLKFNV